MLAEKTRTTSPWLLAGLAVVVVCCLYRPLWAKTPPPAPDAPVRLDAELFRLPANDPSGRLLAVLRLTPAPGWHAYSADSLASGQPATASLSADEAPVAALFPPGAPRPDAFEPEKVAKVYEASTPIFVPLSETVSSASALTGQVRIFSCSDASCWPSTLTVHLPLAGRSSESLPAAASTPWWPQFVSLRQSGQPGQPDAVGAPAAMDKVAGAPETAAAVQSRSSPVAAPAEPGPRAGAVAPPGGADPGLTPRSFTPALEVSSLLKAALLAFAAGFVLNFMPCVLPVVSLKLSGLLAICGEEGKRERLRILREHNFFFALGIVVYFLCLSLLLGAFGLAWGEMFQTPWLAMVVSVVLFALSLSLFGLFHLPVIDLKVPGGGRGHTRRGAFLTGVLATLLATPCSGPFLGGVLAWTLLKPLPVVVTVFAVIGLGMAAPYGVLAIWPRLVRFLPRPGSWMTGLERTMAFILAATCIYFLSLVPPARLPAALIAMWATGLGAYIYGRGATLSQPPAKRLSLRFLAVAVAGGGLALALFYTPPDETRWLAYSPESFEARLGKENLVVDFTADWCPTCKFLERTVLTPPRLAEWANRHGVAFMKVDLTSQQPRAMALLRRLGSQSIPMVAFFPAGPQAAEPLVLRDLYTTGQFEQALREAFGLSPRVAVNR
jgi:thiol:disulfide interchange protein